MGYAKAESERTLGKGFSEVSFLFIPRKQPDFLYHRKIRNMEEAEMKYISERKECNYVEAEQLQNQIGNSV